MARLSNEELKSQFPSFTYPDIGAVFYGDIPACIVNDEYEKQWGKYDCCVIERYIRSIYGDFECYSTLCGDIYIKDGEILWGEHTFSYKGKRIQMVVDKLYGERALYFRYISHTAKDNKWWGNSKNIFSFENPIAVNEIDKYDVEEILDKGDKDYGVAVSMLYDTAKTLYKENPENKLKEVQQDFINQAKAEGERERKLEAEWKQTQNYRIHKIFDRLISKRDTYIDKGDYRSAFKTSLEINELKCVSLEDYKKGKLVPEYITPYQSVEAIKQWYLDNYGWKSNFDIKQLEV